MENIMPKTTTLAVAALVLAVLVWAQPQPTPAAPKSDAGRFQIFSQPATNEVLGSAFLVDTTTGKVWRQIHLEGADGDDNGLLGEPHIWVPMTRLDSERELSAFYLRHPGKDKK